MGLLVHAVQANGAKQARGKRGRVATGRRSVFHVINSRGVAIEGGLLIAIRGQRHDGMSGAAIGGHPANVLDVALIFGEPSMLGAFDEKELRAVGRPLRRRIISGKFAELHGRSAGGRNFPKLAAVRVRPGDVGNPFGVRRKDWFVFAHTAGGQAARLASGQIHEPDLSHGAEGDLLSVGRLVGPAHLAHGERAVVNDVIGVHARAEIEVNFGAERDQGDCLRSDIYALDVAVTREDHGFGIGSEGISRQHIVYGETFLIVALHGQSEPALFERFQIADAQAGLRVVARGEHEPASVG